MNQNESLELIELLIDFDPDNYSYLLHKTELLINMKNYNVAIKLAIGCIMKDKDNWKAHYLKGVCLYESRKLELILSEFKIALSLNADDKKLKLGLYHESLAQSEKAIDIDSKNINEFVSI